MEKEAAAVGLLWTYLRNQIRFKPKGRKASREVTRFLREQGYEYRSVEIWMGLTPPEGLCCLIFFRRDAELSRFGAAGQLHAVSERFRQALAGTGYPAFAVPQVDVSAHSDETVAREGGYFRYFK